jgi:hypothetical protein
MVLPKPCLPVLAVLIFIFCFLPLYNILIFQGKQPSAVRGRIFLLDED